MTFTDALSGLVNLAALSSPLPGGAAVRRLSCLSGTVRDVHGSTWDLDAERGFHFQLLQLAGDRG